MSPPRMIWPLPPVLGEEFEPDVARRTCFGAPIVRQLINDVEAKSPEVSSVSSRLYRLEVRRRPGLFYLDAQTFTEELDDHPEEVLAVLGSMLHGVGHEFADHQSGVVAPRPQGPGREGIIQRRPRKKGGLRRGSQDHFMSQRVTP